MKKISILLVCLLLASCNLQLNSELASGTSDNTTSEVKKIKKSELNQKRLAKITDLLSQKETKIFSSEDKTYDYTRNFFNLLYYADGEWVFYAFDTQKEDKMDKHWVNGLINEKFTLTKDKISGRKTISLKSETSPSEGLNCMDLNTTFPYRALDPIDRAINLSKYSFTGKPLIHTKITSNGCQGNFHVSKNNHKLLSFVRFDVKKAFEVEGEVYVELNVTSTGHGKTNKTIFLKTEVNKESKYNASKLLNISGVSHLKKSLAKGVSVLQSMGSLLAAPSILAQTCMKLATREIKEKLKDKNS